MFLCDFCFKPLLDKFNFILCAKNNRGYENHYFVYSEKYREYTLYSNWTDDILWCKNCHETVEEEYLNCWDIPAHIPCEQTKKYMMKIMKGTGYWTIKR